MFRFWQVWSTVGLYGVVPCWKDGRRGQGAFRTVWAGCGGAGRVCEFPQRAGCRRSGNLPLESASAAAGRAGLPRAACRTGLLTRDRAAKARRPARSGKVYMRASKTYGAAEQPATASAGRRLQACQPTRCRQPARLGHRLAQSFTCDRGSQSRTAAFTAMITTHEPGLFHGSRRRRRPGRSHGNPSFCPRLELIRAFLLTGLDPIDLHNIPPKSHKHRTLQGARVSLSSFRVKAACVSHRQRREPPGTADELVWRQLPSCDWIMC